MVGEAAKEASACNAGGALDLRVTAPGLPRGGRVRVAIVDEAKHAWELDLRSKASLGLAKGTYALTIAGAHYRTVRKRVRVGDKAETVAVVLEPLPALSGRVLERDNK